MRTALMAALMAAVLLVACESTGIPEPPTAPGLRVAVEMLDESFVRYEGRRMALDLFLYEMRLNARLPREHTDRIGTLEVALPAAGVGSPTLDRLLLELKKAGVPEVHIGGGA